MLRRLSRPGHLPLKFRFGSDSMPVYLGSPKADWKARTYPIFSVWFNEGMQFGISTLCSSTAIFTLYGRASRSAIFRG